MKAAVRDRYGPPEVVRIEEVERPEPAAGEILVRVRAASVNRADLDGLLPRPQFSRLFVGLRRPRNRRLGIDVAGVVERVGEGVTAFRPGDAVFADLFPYGSRGQGAFAEFVCAPEAAFAALPAGLTFEVAATLPHSAILALQGLRLRSGRTIASGDRVLIDGASGNVGPFAVQIAKAAGAEVTGVASGAKLDFVRSLGADHVIDYRTTDYTGAPQRYDWILDTESHHPLRAVRRALRPHGAYVTLGGDDRAILAGLIVGPLISRVGTKRSSMMLWWKPFHRPDVETITAMVAAGTIKPAIDRRYPLSGVVDALCWVADGHSKGKVVVTMDGTGERAWPPVSGPSRESA